MFLRGPLASRLSLAILRLRGCSAPSTSTSTSLFSTSNHAQSRCHNHAVPTSVPQLARHFGASLAWIRGGSGQELKKAEEVEGARTEDTNNNQSGADPIQIRAKLMIMLQAFAIVISLPLSIILDWEISARSHNRIPANAVHVDLDTFLEKYLRAGEIEKITHVSYLRKAVGTMRFGAIIDGKPVDSEYVVVECKSEKHFGEAVRKVESELGISMSQSVPIEIFAPLYRINFINDVCTWIMLGAFIYLNFSKLGNKAQRRIQTSLVNSFLKKIKQ